MPYFPLSIPFLPMPIYSSTCPFIHPHSHPLAHRSTHPFIGPSIALSMQFLKNFIKAYLIYNVVLISAIQHSNSDIHIYNIYIIFHILFHYASSLDVEHSSLCYTAGPCCWGKDWEFGISKCKLFYIEWVNNKVL